MTLKWIYSLHMYVYKYVPGPMPGAGFTAMSMMNVFPTLEELAVWLQAVTGIKTYTLNFKTEKSTVMSPNRIL